MTSPRCAARLAAFLASLAPTALAAPSAREEIDPLFRTLEWRCIGPSRGGRVQAVAGVPGDPLTYYMGATGGGVWKTTDAGSSWRNVTDTFVGTGSVGAIAVAPSDPNVVYVGMGEVDVRGNFSHGDGVYRSVDAGRTWTHLGLPDARQIGRIRVDPRDPDLVYVAALGHVFGPSTERGVFRSRDGGATWENVLFVDESTGAVDLAMDMANPRVLYAAFWQVRRTPWSLESGGPGSGLYRTADRGDTWTAVTEGLPKGVKGKIGVAVAPARGDRVWALVEAEDGGLFRSDDAGATFSRVNSDRRLRQRAWYYTRITADTRDADSLYVMNVELHKTTDGGRSFTSVRVPHGDNHDLWIAPEDGLRMVNGNDGGASVSFDGGRTWSRQDNQPTAQLYHVITDDGFPYRVYGAQQDNATISISSRSRLGWRDDGYSVGGGESGYIAPMPGNPEVVYAGSYGGYLTRYDHRTRTLRNVTVWPEDPMGAGAADLDHRFQWTFPIVISPHDPRRIYAAGNVLFQSEDEGQRWRAISPDLTTNDKSRQEPSGGPITKDNTSVEYYCTIFTVAESPLRAGTIWCGSDDGLVHVTADGGATWTNVTPAGMGEWPMISLIEPSPHEADAAYVAVNRYKMDDFTPTIYRTRDRGATWDLVAEGIAKGAFVRAVRADPTRRGLLYAGTETGVSVSFDDGDHWRSLQLALPVVPVTDLAVKDEDLVIATQGRSFWMLEDLAPLRQYDPGAVQSPVLVLEPGITYRQGWDAVRIHYAFAPLPAGEVVAEIVGADGAVLRTWKGKGEGAPGPAGAAGGSDDEEEGERAEGPGKLAVKEGMSLLRWDMRGDGASRVPGAVSWGGTTRGPLVAPGMYRVRFTIDGATVERSFTIARHPRIDTPQAALDEQFTLLVQLRDAIDAAHDAVNSIRAARGQIDAAAARAEGIAGAAKIAEAARALKEKLTAIEESLIQTKSEAPQDPLNFPIKLNDKIGALMDVVEGDYPVTAAARAVFAKLRDRLDEHLRRLDAVRAEDVAAFNALVRAHEVPAVTVP
jgi:photosystem II stability/assembly factor-like uncharacterized protein